MPGDDISIIDLETGLSVISTSSLSKEQNQKTMRWISGISRTPNQDHGVKRNCNMSNKSQNNPRTLNLQRESWSNLKSDVKMNRKPSGTVQDYDNIALTRHAQTFIENVGMQGVRYIFMRDAFWLRRLIWILICLTASGYCWYVTITNWKNYRTFPTATKSEIHYVNKMPFPAVTICNYNIFQRNRLNDTQIAILEDMYKPYPFFENETGRDPARYDHINMKEFMIDASFQFYHHIGLCSYKGRGCDYSITYTKMRDIGMCFTFDPNMSQHNSMKDQILPGPDGGLTLGLAVWQNDWCPGPYMNYEGFTIAVHDPSLEVILLQDMGTTMAVGHTTDLIISKKEISLLPPPHGQCGTRKLQHHEKYSEEACWLECNTNNLIQICGCRHTYMPGNDSVRYCNNINMLHCKDKLRKTGLPQSIACDCPPPCTKVHYDTKHKATRITEGTREYVLENFGGFDLKTTGVLVNVYHDSLDYTTETEEATYTVEKLLCDIGGAGGLFLGASFMSFCEVVDFLLFVVYLCTAKMWKKRNNSTGKVNP